jgi:hypothetical protein
MAATLTKGTTYTAGSSVTAANLHALVESATIANIDRDNIDRASVTPATRQTAEPSAPSDSEVWQSSTTNLLATRDDGNARWLPASPNCRSVTLASTSAAAPAGTLLKATAITTVSVADGGLGGTNVVGVATHAITPGSDGVMIVHGICKALSTGTINAGEAVQLSGTSGSCASVGAGGAGIGGGVVGIALQAASGGSVWIKLRR